MAAGSVLVLVVAAAWLALSDTPATSAPDSARVPAGPGGIGGWDSAAEAELATRPMLALPAEASAPQPLAIRPAIGELRLPSATGDIAGIPAGFPRTPEGAVAALAALTAQGLRGADPRIYATTYQVRAAPGAPAAEHTHLSTLLTVIRSTAGIPPTGPVPGLTMAWHPLQGQIKGVLDDGRYVVACVLGQFSANYQGQVVVYGVGDCQAMRWVTGPTPAAPGQWLISSGPGAAPSPDAWPGSQDSVNAGFVELR